MAEPEEIESDFINEHGFVMGGEKLMMVMGFKSMPAFRKAIRENRLGIVVFNIPGRQGKFALTKEVANFIEKCRKEKN